jgi:hypothetical protein
MLPARTVKDRHSDVFTFLHGDLGLSAGQCYTPDELSTGGLVYASDARQLAAARSHQPAILIVPAIMADSVNSLADPASCCFSVQSIAMGMAVLLGYFDLKDQRFAQWRRRQGGSAHGDRELRDHRQRDDAAPACIRGGRMPDR